eukprot:TRINITY_DN11514_c0_g1_i4.p1 TRINITY_DN11514_c0_g1~~TRINITY_DN11514_c0_g1_i4.p1  ORF type:complete len:602 (+),score=107.32 TRINITY_DN11514_c0_g1_i4:136-1941(+)
MAQCPNTYINTLNRYKLTLIQNKQMNFTEPDNVPSSLKSLLSPVHSRQFFIPPSVSSEHSRELSRDDFEFIPMPAIGSGRLGSVYKAVHKSSAKVYAVKVLSKALIAENAVGENVKAEMKIMYSINHPNILKLHTHFEDEENLYQILEYAAKGKLMARIKKLGKLDERTANKYFKQLVFAIDYLHSQSPPILHRNITSENILLHDDSIKLFNFSSAAHLKERRTSYCGTLDYLAPEMILRTGHNRALDLWNAGVLLFEMLAGKLPFEGFSQTSLFKNVLKLDVRYPKTFPKLAKDLLQGLLRIEPGNRIRIENILEHPWLRSNMRSMKSLGHCRCGLSIDRMKDKFPLEEDKEDSPQIFIKRQKVFGGNNTKVKSQFSIGNLNSSKKSEEFLSSRPTADTLCSEKLKAEEVVKADYETLFDKLLDRSLMREEQSRKLKVIENELEIERKAKELAIEKNKELQEQLRAQEVRYKELIGNYESLQEDKDLKEAALKKRIELLEIRLVTKRDETANLDALQDITFMLLNDTKDFIMAKIGKGEDEALGKEVLELQKAINDLKLKHESEKIELLLNYKKDLELSLIHICRCRRYAVCRSRWSPYH